MRPVVMETGRAGRLAAVVLLAAVTASPGPEPEPRVVRLSLDVLETQAGEPTRAAGGWSAELRAGESTGVFYLLPSRAVGGEGMADCGGVEVTASLAPPTTGPGRSSAWKAEARLLDASLDGTSVEVSWTRFAGRGASGMSGAQAQGTDVVTLRAGEHALLDVVQGPALGSDGCVRNLALDLSVDVPPPAGLENEAVAYEIWMVHQPKSGDPVSRVWRTTSIQGEEATFRFPDETLGPLPGWGPDDGPAELIVSIEGSVRGWLRPEGTIDLVLSAYRDLVFADGRGALGEMGRKTVQVRPGEAVRLVLPGAPADARGEPFAAYLEGHGFSLTVVAVTHP